MVVLCNTKTLVTIDNTKESSPSPSSLDQDCHQELHSHTVLVSVVCPLLCVAGSVGLGVSIVVCCLASFSLAARLAIQGVLQDGFCNGVVSSDVAKPGELTSFHCCQQGLLLSSKEVHLLYHIFVCFML